MEAFAYLSFILIVLKFSSEVYNYKSFGILIILSFLLFASGLFFIYIGSISKIWYYNFGGVLFSLSYFFDHFGISSFHDTNEKHHEAIYYTKHVNRTLLMNILLYVNATLFCCFLSINFFPDYEPKNYQIFLKFQILF